MAREYPIEVVVEETKGYAADYLENEFGLTTKVVYPKRTGKDKQKMMDMVQMYQLLEELPDIYWKDHSKLQTIHAHICQIYRYVVSVVIIATSVLHLHDMDACWKNLKEKVSERDIRRLAIVSSKMTVAQRKRTIDICRELWDIYNKY